MVVLHGFPDGRYALPRQRGCREHGRCPGGAGRLHVVQGAGVLPGRPARLLGVVPVGLVDHQHLGQLQDAPLDALEAVAGAGQHQHEEAVDHLGHGELALAHTNGLDEDHVVAGGLAEQHGLAGLAVHAAEAAFGRARADEAAPVDREPRHAGLVAQDGAPGAAAGRVDGEHGEALAGLDQAHAQALDEGGLAHAGHARDADPVGAARAGKQLLEHLLGELLVPAQVRLDERDGAAEHRTIPRQHALDVVLAGEPAPPSSHPAARSRPRRSPARR